MVAPNKVMNFLINFSLPKTLQGGLAGFYRAKMSMFVACWGRIYSQPEPSSLFHTFPFQGNSVLLWKAHPRRCNSADTDLSITREAAPGELSRGKQLDPNTEWLNTSSRFSLRHPWPTAQPARNITGNSGCTGDRTAQVGRKSWKRRGFW